jgi:Domain of unknown function (DUF1707)
MSAPASPAAGRRSRRRASDTSNTSYTNPGLRVSDADRAAVADQLSRHYADGRLSQAEFDERLDQAMNARTRSDLSGLLADLPGAEAPTVPAPRRAGGPSHRILAPLLVIAIIITTAHLAFWTLHLMPWLLIGLLAFLWLRYSPRRHRHIP